MNGRTRIMVSAEALVAMIGGNTEVEIEVRNGIIQEFAKKHLTPLVNDEKIKDLYRRITTNLQETVNDALQPHLQPYFTKDSWSSKITLNKKFTEEIKDVARRVVDETIHAIVADEVAKIDIESLLQRRIDFAVKSRIDSGIAAELKKVSEQLTKPR